MVPAAPDRGCGAMMRSLRAVAPETVQFPFLMIPPHKLKWLFVFKTVLVLVSSVAVVISMTQKAGGTGDIWNLPYGVHGSARRWLILSCVSSYTGSWYANTPPTIQTLTAQGYHGDQHP